MAPLHRILMPTDFSIPSERVIEHGFELARGLRAEVYVLHVLTRPKLPDCGAFSRHTSRRVEERALAALTRLIRTCGGHGLTTQPLVRAGDATSSILEAAETYGVDLIVVGPQRLRGLRSALLGSVAEGVVNRACCPVLVVPPPADVALRQTFRSASSG